MDDRQPGEGRYAHVEREQRWLVGQRPHQAERVGHIVDRYITGTRLRLRRVEKDGNLVYKLGQKVRLRYDDPEIVNLTNVYLSKHEYAVLAALPAAELQKTRWSVDLDGRQIAIDEFEGRLDWLTLAEVELAPDDERLALPHFAWADVTDDDRFSGGTLAHMTETEMLQLLAASSRMSARMIDPEAREEMALELDRSRIDAYCVMHAEELGGRCTEHQPLRMVVYLAGDLDAHRRALEPELDHPDRLELRPARFLATELRRIHAAVIAHCQAFGGGWNSGRTPQSVTLAVPPGAEHLAEEVVARFGDVIDIEPWPGERRKLVTGR